MDIYELEALIALANPRTNSVAFQRYDPAAWAWLAQQDLVGQGEQGPVLTERGQVFIDHLLSLPLPEKAWRMPGQSQPLMPIVSAEVPPRKSRRRSAPGPSDEGMPPPAPPPASMLPNIEIPTDPVERHALANRLLDSGWGMNEVGEKLKLSDSEMRAIFGAT